MINFVQFTENDKRLIIALLLVFILLFVIVGYISLFVKKIMKFQAKRADDLLHDVYATKTITTEGKLRWYGIRKNWSIFFRQASIPLIILGAAWIFFAVYGIVFKEGNFAAIDVWGYGEILEEGGTAQGGSGIGTLFYVFDWPNAPTVQFFANITLYGKPPVLNIPHISADAWFSYIFMPLNLIGIIWLLVCVQAYIARSFRIFKLSATIFKKTLEKPAPSNPDTTIPN